VAVIAPAASAVGTTAAVVARLIIALDVAVAAVGAGLIVIIMALEAGIVAAGVALAAAVEAAVADQAAFLSGTCSAVRAVFSLVDGAVYAHVAIFAVIAHAIRAGTADAALGVFITDGIALAAVRAGHILSEMAFETQMILALGTGPTAGIIAAAALIAKTALNSANTALGAVTVGLLGAVDAHPAVFAPFRRTDSAALAVEAPHRISYRVAVAAVWTCHIFREMAFKAEMIRALGAFTAAVIAPAAVTEIYIIMTGAALRTVLFVIYGAVDTHRAVFAPIAVDFTFSAFSAMMVVAAAIAGSAVVAAVAEPLVVAPCAAVLAVCSIVIARKRADR